jgi:hypothetical protein
MTYHHANDRVLCEAGEQVREGAELLVFVDQ